MTLAGIPAPDYDDNPEPGSDANEFYTPRWILDLLPAIDIDPCSPPHRPVRAERHFVLSDGQDGLAATWSGTVFCNPPYSRGSLPAWVSKCFEEWCSGRAHVIALIPSRTGSKYWADFVWPYAHAVGFITGRVAFDTVSGPSGEVGKFDNALVVWSCALAKLMRKRTLNAPIVWVVSGYEGRE